MIIVLAIPLGALCWGLCTARAFGMDIPVVWCFSPVWVPLAAIAAWAALDKLTERD